MFLPQIDKHIYMHTKPCIFIQVCRLAKAAGTPLRHGKYGYKHDSFVRFKTGRPDLTDILFKALAPVYEDGNGSAKRQKTE